MPNNETFKALEYCATFTDGDCSECQYQNGACRAELIQIDESASELVLR